MASGASNNFYRNPRLTTIAFAAGILLFFLPFLEIKCNGTSVAQLSGKDMVFGSAPDLGKDLANYGKTFSNNDSLKNAPKTNSEGKAYPLAIVALLLGIAGLLFSLSKARKNYLAMMLAGAAGAVLLVVLIIQATADVRSQISTETGTTDPFSDQFSGRVNVTVAITAWFVICILCYAAAAFFSHKQRGLSAGGEVVPAHAPQLNLDNPGDQSNFPSAPTGDKDLG